MIIGTLSSALLVEEGELDPLTVELLELVPLGAICAWILLSGQLARATRQLRPTCAREGPT